MTYDYHQVATVEPGSKIKIVFKIFEQLRIKFRNISHFIALAQFGVL